MNRSVATFVLLMAVASCRRSGEATPEVRRVRCADAKPLDVADTIDLRGTIAPLPDRDAQVSAQVAGRILQLLVREGDTVAAGAVLARLDDGPLVDDLHAAEALVAKAHAEVQNADATAARVQRVFEHGIAAKQEVDDAWTRARSTRAAESEAEAGARRARRQVDRATIRSPLAGVVVRLFRRPGELVDGTPATPIVEIVDPSRLELVGDTTANDLVRLAKGQPAEISISALPSTRWKGSIAAVSPSVDRTTGLGTVRVAIDAAARPPIGALGSARIQVGSPRQSVGVPAAAVRTGPGDEIEVVVCGDDGRAHVSRAPRGASVGGRVETKGLVPGQRVVVSPVLGITDGEPIEVEK
ncbi:MAG TPA: efflux RND transporter periplasmic adaptor subunit [Polyangia bacterium]|jgi:RND family efflux transporter MFP subunit|nr:efflux RND transporter periplasmic adaptor subunit [Polyangia bacterium]